MSTDCAVIIKLHNEYIVYPYIKWDGYPEGKGRTFQQILTHNRNDNESIVSDIGAIASEFCRSSRMYSFGEALNLMRSYYIDYTYYIDLDSQDYTLYLFMYNAFVSLAEYDALILSLNLCETMTMKRFAHYISTMIKPSLTRVALEMAENYCHKFLPDKGLMETE